MIKNHPHRSEDSNSCHRYIHRWFLTNGNESFSDVVNRLVSSAKKKNIMELAGKWPGGKKELDRIEKILREDRKKFKLRKVEF